MKRLWDAAMIPIFDMRTGAPPLKKRPGELRQHVLDEPGGLRTILSRERYDEGLFQHISISSINGNQRRIDESVAGWLKVGFKIVQVTSGGVTHLTRSDPGYYDGTHAVNAMEGEK